MRACLNQLFGIMHLGGRNPFDLNRLGIIEGSDLTASLYAAHLKHPPGLADSERIAALRPRVQRELAESHRGRILVKTHNARSTDRGHPLINDRVTNGAVYLVRNPLDVAVSFAAFRSISIDRAIEDMARPGFGNSTNAKTVYWICETWSESVRSWTGRGDPTTLVLRYEDILVAPIKALADMARHLRWQPTDDQIAQAVAMTSFDRLQSMEKATGFSERPSTTSAFFRKGTADQWRSALSAEQVGRIVTAHGEMMERFGYLPA